MSDKPVREMTAAEKDGVLLRGIGAATILFGAAYLVNAQIELTRLRRDMSILEDNVTQVLQVLVDEGLLEVTT